MARCPDLRLCVRFQLFEGVFHLALEKGRMCFRDATFAVDHSGQTSGKSPPKQRSKPFPQARAFIVTDQKSGQNNILSWRTRLICFLRTEEFPSGSTTALTSVVPFPVVRAVPLRGIRGPRLHSRASLLRHLYPRRIGRGDESCGSSVSETTKSPYQ